MITSLIALAFVAIASGAGWVFLLTVGKDVLRPEDRNVLLSAWIVVTIALFTVPNGAVFLLLSLVALGYLRLTGADPIALALFLLCAVPPAGVNITGLPGINYLLQFTFAILLSLVLLLPTAVKHVGVPGPDAFGVKGVRSFKMPAVGVDWMFLALCALVFVLGFRETSFTDGLRQGTVWTLTAVIPYLAVSRSIVTWERLRRCVSSLVACLVVIAFVGLVASVVRWQFYDTAQYRLFDAAPAPYIIRAGLLRVGASMGASPISYGLLMMIGAALCAGFARDVSDKWRLRALVVACLIGLFVSVSRGPMVGAVAALLAYQLSRPNPMAALAKIGAWGVAAIPFLLVTETGRGLLSFIPFVGNDEHSADTVSYRADLLDAGLEVMGRQFLFGSPSYLDEPEMQAMVQGQGIIDMVNSYLSFALLYGVVAAALWMAIIAFVSLRTLLMARRLDDEADGAMRVMGGALFAALSGYAVTIATTSYIDVIPVIGWLLVGLNVAYARVVAAHLAAPAAATAPSSPLEDQAAVPPRSPEPLPAYARERPDAPVLGSSFGLQSTGGASDLWTRR